ncbi:hypothetical protein E8E13_004290 [Curvularia kusanoi]|uniref:mRNA export factor GLE1 n=1 Tax=Curvularia kusanoi TaxID=90978 RepID=A0A9P4T5Z1_CURKU|nr:hypothetical protein E8E13_004290 [Curvularia kusanoi]
MPAKSGASSSSMHTRASFGSSIIESSPVRQSPTRNGLRNPRASLARDPYESPSRQMQLEFNLKLSISDKNFNEQLDQAAAERARLHEEQLARAAEEHAKVRRGAELELQRLTLEEEKARLRSQEEQQRAIERLQKEKEQQQAEAHRRQLEAQQREEELARKAAEHQKKLQEAAARQNAQREQEAAAERQRKEKEEADRRAKEAADAAEKARAQQAAQQVAQQAPVQARPATAVQPTAAAKAPVATQAPNDAINNIHTKYLELHQRMKEFRKAFWNEHKQPGKPLKAPVGDARRNFRLRMGQITAERASSQAAIKSLRADSFDVALNTPGPTIDIRPFLVNQTIPPLANEAEAQYPAFLLYMWIIFEKFLLKQFDKEADNEDGRVMQELGLVAASLFADQKYMWKGISLIDVLLAKMHKVCPIMFGLRGNMNTVEGQKRLGWVPIGDNPPTATAYMQRIRGLSAGFAAMSLRAFKTVPALPMSEYWHVLVHVCNTPTQDLYPGHFAILNGLLRDFYKKFLGFYGVQARGVLRRAVIDVPARAPERCKDAAGVISVFREQWKKENLVLD